MNDLDKKDLLELIQIIKTSVHTIGSVQIKNDRINRTSQETIIEALNEIKGCADTIIEIVENKPHKIERMF
jgi:hypothetical protein